MTNYFRLVRHRVATVCLMLTMCLSLSQSALAQSRVDSSRLCEITINYKDDGTPIEGAEFELYLIADIDENYAAEVSDEFALSAVDLDFDLDDDNIDLNSRAVSLENYVAAREAEGMPIEPVRDGYTDSEGELDFDKLNEGLYLLVGEDYTQGGKIYEPLAELITLPYIDDNDRVDYDITVIPKMVSKDPEQPSTSTDNYYLTVLKIWKDDESTSRPDEVTVVLVKDDEVYDRVKLNQDNSWRYSWSGLDKNARWQLYEENVPSGYTVTAELDGNVFVVTNTKKTVTPPGSGDIPKKKTTTEATTVTEAQTETTTESEDRNPIIPNDSRTTTESPVEVTTDLYKDTEVDNPGSVENVPGYKGDSYSEKRNKQTPGDVADANAKNSQPNLPQTGKLWWPVPVFSLVGVMLIIVGVFMRRCHRDEAKNNQ